MTNSIAHPPTALTPCQSETVKIARVLCIFMMTYVHVHPWEAEVDIAQYGVRAWDAIRFYIVEGVGRSSVALLSVVSGYLLLIVGTIRSHGALVGKKAKSLLLPMALWNLLALVLIAALALAAGAQPSLPAETAAGNIRAFLDATIALTDWPQLTPLAFLRDIFVCALLSPLLIALVRWNWVAALAIVFAIYAADLRSVVLLRPGILFFFTVGLVAAIQGLPRMPALPVRLGIGLAFLLVPMASVLLMLGEGGGADREVLLRALRIVQRMLGVGAVLFVAAALIDRRPGRWLAWLEPYVFFLFCSHALVFSLLWKIWEPLLGGYYGTAYPVFFLLAPVAAFAASVIAVRVLDRLAPRLLTIINGGRRLRPTVRKDGGTQVADPGIVTAPAKKQSTIAKAG